MAHALLDRLAAAPKPYAVVVTYEDGAERRIPMLSLSAAQNCVEREARKVGRCLIDPETGNPVTVVSVGIVNQ